MREFFEEELTDAIYRTAGYSWQTPLEEVPVENMCDSVTNEFAVIIEDEFEYTVKSPIRAPVNGAKHFVAIVTETPTTNLNTPIVVDGTIRQFGEQYPTILIEPIDSSVVNEYYDKIEF